MLETIRSYFDVILVERSWSWTLIGILYLLFGLMVRGWFINPVLSHAKLLEKQVYQKIKLLYLKRSILGWIFFLVSLIIFVLLWNREPLFPLTVMKAFTILGAVACFILSILFHLQALAVATIHILKVQIHKDAADTV